MLAALRYELGGPTVYTFVGHFTGYSKGEQDVEIQNFAHQLAEDSEVVTSSLVQEGYLQAAAHAVRRSGLSGLLRDMHHVCTVCGVYFYGKSCVCTLN
jgi:hypothetical protein